MLASSHAGLDTIVGFFGLSLDDNELIDLDRNHAYGYLRQNSTQGRLDAEPDGNLQRGSISHHREVALLDAVL